MGRTRDTVRPRLDRYQNQRARSFSVTRHILPFPLSLSLTRSNNYTPNISVELLFRAFPIQRPFPSALSRRRFHRECRDSSQSIIVIGTVVDGGKCRWIFVNFPRKLAPLDRVDSLIGSIASELLWNGSSVNETFLSSSLRREEVFFFILYNILKAPSLLSNRERV